MMPRETLYIGLDAGGTKTELLAAARQDDELVNIVGPTAQVARLGPEAAAGVLAELVREVRRTRPEDTVTAVCAGMAGAGRDRDCAAVTAALRQALGDEAPEHIVIVHDAEIALEAAFEGESGLMAIAGTGSVALARTDEGELLRVGGWGYRIGDEGSGYVLGRHGLRAAAAAFDGGPATRIRDLLADEHGIETPDDLIERVYQDDWPMQEAAPVVLEAARDGDEVAAGIVAEQTEQLARQVSWLAARCESVVPQVALLGGLNSVPYYADRLAEALAALLPEWQVRPPLHRPVVGAWRLAYQAAHAASKNRRNEEST